MFMGEINQLDHTDAGPRSGGPVNPADHLCLCDSFRVHLIKVTVTGETRVPFRSVMRTLAPSAVYVAE